MLPLNYHLYFKMPLAELRTFFVEVYTINCEILTCSEEKPQQNTICDRNE